MTSADERPVWYASYGSNCSRDRFLTYLRGGRAEGAGRDQIGARDTRDPSGDEPVRFETAVCFVGRSTRWGGAPAFLEHDRSARPGALGRRYCVTRQQFADVLAQESGRPFDSVPLPDLDELEPGTRVVIGDGFYDALVILAPIDGVPCLSFTSPQPPDAREPSPPSEPYLRTIITGLAEIHDLDDEALATHLSASRGIRPTWTLAAMTALLGRGAQH